MGYSKNGNWQNKHPPQKNDNLGRLKFEGKLTITKKLQILSTNTSYQ
jgi:hypothetical protein